MITEVIFNNIMKKSDYEKLKDVYDFGEITNRISVDKYSDNLSIMPREYYYYDEVTTTRNESGDTVYTHDGEELGSWQVSKRPGTEYIGICNENNLIQLTDLEQLYNITPTVKCTIEKVVPFRVDCNAIELENAINNLSQKINFLSDKQFDFNAKCNVQVPGLGLLRIKTVDYVCDMCTEKLQRRLNEGWRIIAACPQPDQRRPDYILGLMDFNEEDND